MAAIFQTVGYWGRYWSTPKIFFFHKFTFSYRCFLFSREAVFVSGKDLSHAPYRLDSKDSLLFREGRNKRDHHVSALARCCVWSRKSSPLDGRSVVLGSCCWCTNKIIYSTSINTILMSINIGINGFGRIGRWVAYFEMNGCVHCSCHQNVRRSVVFCLSLEVWCRLSATMSMPW